VGLVLLLAVVVSVLALAMGLWAVVTGARDLQRAVTPLAKTLQQEATPQLKRKAAAASAAVSRLQARRERMAERQAELAASVASGRRAAGYVAEALAPLEQLRGLR
jgi:predicted Holliday junction resolvase-like endonuclease